MHTKGEWKIAGQGDGNQQLPILANGKIIAAIRDHGILGDAKLISAAPDLYESIKQLCDETTIDKELWDEMESMDEGQRITLEVTIMDLKRIKNAIAKAEGR